MPLPTLDELFVKVDPTLLEPQFLVRVRSLLAGLLARGIVFYASEGYRTPARSELIYSWGRTTKNPNFPADPGLGRISSNARAFESAHNYGIAIDLTRDAAPEVPGLHPDWTDASYDVLGPAAAELGLVWGGSWAWHDRPHVQRAGFVTAVDLLPLRHTWQTITGTDRQRLQAVWGTLPPLH